MTTSEGYLGARDVVSPTQDADQNNRGQNDRGDPLVRSLKHALDRQSQQYSEEVRKRHIVEKERDVLAEKVTALESRLHDTTAMYDKLKLEDDIRKESNAVDTTGGDLRLMIEENDLIRSACVELRDQVLDANEAQKRWRVNEELLKADIRSQLTIIEGYQQNNSALTSHLSALAEEKKMLCSRMSSQEIRVNEIEELQSLEASQLLEEKRELQHRLSMLEQESKKADNHSQCVQERVDTMLSEHERMREALQKSIDAAHAEKEETDSRCRILHAEHNEYRLLTEKLLDAERVEAENKHRLMDTNQDLERRLSNSQVENAKLATQHGKEKAAAGATLEEYNTSKQNASRTLQELEQVRVDYVKARDAVLRLQEENEHADRKITELAVFAEDNDLLMQKNSALHGSLDSITDQFHDMEANYRILYNEISEDQTKWEHRSSEQAAELNDARTMYMEMEDEKRRLAGAHALEIKQCQEDAKIDRKRVADECDRLQGRAEFWEEQSVRLRNRLEAMHQEFRAEYIDHKSTTSSFDIRERL